MRALAAAVFLGMAILFLGIAATTDMVMAWVMAGVNVLLFVGNLMIYMSNEPGREKPPTP